MADHKPMPGKKYYTVGEANACLPLVRAIVRDITAMARGWRERQERLNRLQPGKRGTLSEAHQEELIQVHAEYERDQEHMREYEQELKKLGVELKDYFTGLIDFPAWMDGREVYLCWRLGEADVTHWHELEAGFAGRQKLVPEMAGR